MERIPYLFIILSLFMFSCGSQQNPVKKIVQEEINSLVDTAAIDYTTFENDLNFLKKYNDVLLLKDKTESSMIAISRNLQARVMTSSSRGLLGRSYGWINRGLFESGDTLDHINPYGGEERFWLGPEGGQYAIFFKPGDPFDLTHWQTPPIIDTEPFDIVYYNQRKASYRKVASVTNYNNFTFDFDLERVIEVFTPDDIYQVFSLGKDPKLSVVGYRSTNTIFNRGTQAWNEDTGMLSIWLLGMFNPSMQTTVVIPYEVGPEESLGKKVNRDYFGDIPTSHLVVSEKAIFFKGDGQIRSKIGMPPLRAKEIFGSFDDQHNVLTIVKYNQPKGVLDYVNSKWETQKQPFRGDVINAYNDGPPSPNEKALGPFYELETSSPALKLRPGESNMHIQLTIHFEGPEASLDSIAQKVLGVSIGEIKNAFKN